MVASYSAKAAGFCLIAQGTITSGSRAVPRQQDRTRTRGTAVALVLRILGHADPLCPGERHVGQRLHQLGLHPKEEGMSQVRVPRRVQHLSQGILVRERLRGGGEDGAHGLGHDALGVGVVANQAAVVWSQRFVEGFAGRGGFRCSSDWASAPRHSSSARASSASPVSSSRKSSGKPGAPRK